MGLVYKNGNFEVLQDDDTPSKDEANVGTARNVYDI